MSGGGVRRPEKTKVPKQTDLSVSARCWRRSLAAEDFDVTCSDRLVLGLLFLAPSDLSLSVHTLDHVLSHLHSPYADQFCQPPASPTEAAQSCCERIESSNKVGWTARLQSISISPGISAAEASPYCGGGRL